MFLISMIQCRCHCNIPLGEALQVLQCSWKDWCWGAKYHFGTFLWGMFTQELKISTPNGNSIENCGLLWLQEKYGISHGDECHFYPEKCLQTALSLQGNGITKALHPHATEAEPWQQVKQFLQQQQKHHHQQLQFSQPYRQWVRWYKL